MIHGLLTGYHSGATSSSSVRRSWGRHDEVFAEENDVGQVATSPNATVEGHCAITPLTPMTKGFEDLGLAREAFSDNIAQWGAIP